MKNILEKLKEFLVNITSDIESHWVSEEQKIKSERQRRDLIFAISLLENLGANNDIEK